MVEKEIRDLQAANFYLKYLTRYHIPPTFREIGEHVGLKSTSGVGPILDRCVEKGYLVTYRRRHG